MLDSPPLRKKSKKKKKSHKPDEYNGYPTTEEVNTLRDEKKNKLGCASAELSEVKNGENMKKKKHKSSLIKSGEAVSEPVPHISVGFTEKECKSEPTELGTVNGQDTEDNKVAKKIRKRKRSSKRKHTEDGAGSPLFQSFCEGDSDSHFLKRSKEKTKHCGKINDISKADNKQDILMESRNHITQSSASTQGECSQSLKRKKSRKRSRHSKVEQDPDHSRTMTSQITDNGSQVVSAVQGRHSFARKMYKSYKGSNLRHVPGYFSSHRDWKECLQKIAERRARDKDL